MNTTETTDTADTTLKNEIDLINDKLNRDVCYDTLEKLSDLNLINDYITSKSVINNISILRNILKVNDVSEEKSNSIINSYIINLIPPGTKGVIRGNKFNQIVKDYIIELSLDPTIYDIQFEKKHIDYITSEIPDWYIYNKINKKIIIGMNQLDLWNGGAQLNRGYKYLINNKLNTNTSKLLCVVCNKKQFTRSNNKAFKIIKYGYDNNTLCYITKLSSIIRNYFRV